MPDYSDNPISPSRLRHVLPAASPATGGVRDVLLHLRDEVEQELRQRILPFWIERAVDRERGGFFGQVDADGRPDPHAPKAGLLHARILWAFARAYRHCGDPAYRDMARRAAAYLVGTFRDPRHGGLYWTVDRDGQALEPHKQTYLQAFGVYGLAEHAHATGDTDALRHAIALHRLVERHGWDPAHGGYCEAFERDWSPRADVRVNPRFDLAVPRTMNTHLHLLEAWTGLARVWPEPTLAARLAALVRLFVDRIVDPRRGHCRLHFNERWEPRSELVSFGHDIEAGWLLVAAARELGDATLQAAVAPLAVALARGVLADGTDPDGGVLYEAGRHGVTVAHKEWWPQAEAVVGFLDTFELTGETVFLDAAQRTWGFIQRRLADPATGEWRWRVDRAGNPVRMPLAGRWKCPYHNARMCIEVAERAERMALRCADAAQTAVAMEPNRGADRLS
jgi:cellobiose epimerase